MVDRTSLLKALEPRAKPTGTQAEVIRKALDKAVIETVLSLPLSGVSDLDRAVQADLEVVLNSLDPRSAEKLAALWEPRRKLDAELKRTVKRDLLDLLHQRRGAYEPVTLSLEEARASEAHVCKEMLRRVAPTRDLKALLSKWDQNFRPTPTAREGYVARLMALLDGAEPVARTSRR